jgi:hypothetical protein
MQPRFDAEEYAFTPLIAESGREVVVDLEAAPHPWDIGEKFEPLDGWSYNATVPGPTIEARQGDTLVVRLTNRLAEPTTIHWHGLRLPAPMDGTEAVQQVVPPGGRFENTASRCPMRGRSGTTRTPTRRCNSSAGSTACWSSAAMTSRSWIASVSSCSTT